ncbi:Scr1 family TA system antitoxin-like transcriptional regulator [Streptomyces sp. NPDC051132]|uniref:Scr1 family TA system antitoxin-like transcriptional regulator n=2 Tax=unclassified Streptomyces TaxID=2593676 RepID=UPI00342F3435
MTATSAGPLALLPVPATLAAPPPGDIVVGAYLRTLRTDAHRTVADIAKTLRLRLAALARIERATHPLPPFLVSDLLRQYGIHDRSEIEVVQRLLADPRDPGRFRLVDHGPGAHDRLAALQRCATTLHSYTSHLLPRPYRTPGYHRALKRPGAAQPGARPAPLGQDPPRPCAAAGPWFTLLLDERVLRQPIGGCRVMACQLGHLLDLIDSKRATIHVVPAHSTVRPLEPAVTEAAVHGHRLYVMERNEGIEYRSGDGYPPLLHNWLGTLLRAALPGESSRDCISQARDHLWRRAALEPDAEPPAPTRGARHP